MVVEQITFDKLGFALAEIVSDIQASQHIIILGGRFPKYEIYDKCDVESLGNIRNGQVR